MKTDVLIAEDEEHIQRLVKIVLKKKGCEVTTADDGEEALELLNEGLRPRLILLDIMMPHKDGLQVLKEVKANEETRDIPVVMLTSMTREDVVIQGIKLGAQGYIKKPFHPSDLIERVKPYLQLNDK